MAYFHGYPQARQAAPPPVPAGRDCGCGRPRMLMPSPGSPGIAGPGPGPFSAGPGTFPPGHEPVWAGPGTFPPGPGLFPPGRGVFALIGGGRVAPALRQLFRLPYRPGISIFQALAGTGLVHFGPNWRILAADGVPIGGGIGYALRLNGRQIPVTLLFFPLQPNDRVELELVSLLREENAQYGTQFFSSYPSSAY